jgi:hypothetical protein
MSTIQQWTTSLEGLDSLQLSKTPKPAPRKGEVLVEIRAVSLNYRDFEGETTATGAAELMLTCRSLQRRVQSPPIRQPG